MSGNGGYKKRSSGTLNVSGCSYSKADLLLGNTVSDTAELLLPLPAFAHCVLKMCQEGVQFSRVDSHRLMDVSQ